MNISRAEQRVLHALAQGGRVDVERGANGRVTAARLVTRDGAILADGALAVFRKLLKKKLIRSEGGRPYRITRRGRLTVRPQHDNR